MVFSRVNFLISVSLKNQFMKFLKTSLIAIGILAIANLSFAQSAEEVVQKHITAIGGSDNWKKINSLKMAGSINANGMEINITQTILHNKAMRQDISLMGMDGYTIVNNKEVTEQSLYPYYENLSSLLVHLRRVVYSFSLNSSHIGF